MSAKEVAKFRKDRKEGGGGGGKNWFSMKAGTYYFFIGRPWAKDGEVWKEVLTHGFWKTKVYCAKNDVDSKTSKSRKCKVDTRLRKLKDEPRNKASKKLFKSLLTREEYLWNVLIAKVKIGSESGKVILKGLAEKHYKIMRLSKSWALELIELFAEDEYREKSVLGITHPKYGYLIRCKREGEGRDDTEYKFKVMGQFPIAKTKAERAELLKTLNDLDKMVKGSSDEELSAFVRSMEKKSKGGDEEDDSDEDEDVEDNESEDDDEDVEKEVKKHLKKKKKHKKEDDDDEDSEEDADEDEEEEDESDESEDDDE